MLLLNNSLETPEHNLAFDESLIEVAEEQTDLAMFNVPEVLRLWEMPHPCVILGRSSQRDVEVNVQACRMDGVPVIRRVSGGATVVAGPGCLMFSLLLKYQSRPGWRMLDVAHSQVMNRIQSAAQTTLDQFGIPGLVQMQGTCDLTLGQRKFSGNALRCKKEWLLYHGTLLLSMPLEWISRYLLTPPRQPEYRERRDHASFVTNLIPRRELARELEFRSAITTHLSNVWQASADDTTMEQTSHLQLLWHRKSNELLHDRYLKANWHESR
jgi:lipoate---protein ligase